MSSFAASRFLARYARAGYVLAYTALQPFTSTARRRALALPFRARSSLAMISSLFLIYGAALTSPPPSPPPMVEGLGFRL